MATIVTRAGKGAPLTHTEVDANFNNLNTDKLESGDVSTVALSGSYNDLSDKPTLGTAAAASTTDFVAQTATTGAAVVPAGTAAQRDGSPLAGYFRFNSDTGKFEGYDGVEWGAVGGGGGFFKGENGSVGDATTGPGDIFRINEQELNTSVTISGTENASCTGPLAVASGVTLTVSAGGTLAVI
jgi:hypothetical protein